MADGGSVKPEVRYEERDVTPQYAKELRANQPKTGKPRTLKRGNLSKLERAIRERSYQLDVNTIKIGWPSGATLDGNHRLQAVINTGITTRMRFAINVPDEALQWIDSGAARSLADHLKLRGEDHAKERAALFGAIAELHDGRSYSPSVEEYDRFADAIGEDLVAKAVQWQFKAKKNMLVSPAFLSACALFITLCERDLEEFFDRVVSAVGEDREVARQLSKRLAKLHLDGAGSGQGDRVDIAKLCCVAAEAYQRGVKLDTARAKEAEAVKAATPEEQRTKNLTALRRFRARARQGWAKDVIRS